MILEQAQQLADLTEQLSESLMAAAICADEIRAILRTELDSHTPVHWGRSQDTKPLNPPRQRPLVDSSTFSVFWAGKTCPLRPTILFRFAQRLARQPNQYITADQLLRGVWEGGIKSPDTIRSAVRHLRQRLSSAGMKDLAATDRYRTPRCRPRMYDLANGPQSGPYLAARIRSARHGVMMGSPFRKWCYGGFSLVSG